MTQYLVGAKRVALVQRVCDLYAEGFTIREVAAEIDYSYCATRNMLVRAEVQLRPRGFRPPRSTPTSGRRSRSR